MKCSAKKAASEVAKEKRGTGGGPVEFGDLSPNKERIVTLTGGLLSATGDDNVKEFGRILPVIKKREFENSIVLYFIFIMIYVRPLST